MNVSLTPELERFARSLVASGRYNSASEVARAGLRLLHERESRLTDLRALVQEGVESGPPGPVDLDAIKAEARAEHKGRRGERDAA